MGKDKEDANSSDEDSTNSTEEKTNESSESEPEEEKQETIEESKTEEKKEEPGEKKNVEELRKVIKVDDSNNEKPKDNTEEVTDLDSTSRDKLEQKRAILQSIKDFNFQIKKNQEEITAVNKKLDSVSKDLDDLVSLYEIVSEQMNPFVGLSKVTKKRIDALENITKEIEDLKTRLGDIESFAERVGADIKNIRVETAEHNMEKAENKLEKETGEIIASKIQKPQQESIEQTEIDTLIEKIPVTTPQKDIAKDDIDIIIERSLNDFTLDETIEFTIDDFIESLLA
jgi:flagellar protein FlaC